MLDIGFGGGDILIRLSRWAKNDGFHLTITAIDSDQRSHAFVEKWFQNGDDIHFKHLRLEEIAAEQESFDFVISNHLMHHLKTDELQNMLEIAKSLARRKVLFNDIERSAIGYRLFQSATGLIPAFRRSFIRDDGMISVRKSFTRAELSEIIPHGYTVEPWFPFRLLACYEAE